VAAAAVARSTRARRVGSDARCIAVRAQRKLAANAPPHDGTRDGARYQDWRP